jgi:hypothetical protein
MFHSFCHSGLFCARRMEDISWAYFVFASLGLARSIVVSLVFEEKMKASWPFGNQRGWTVGDRLQETSPPV